MLLHPTRSSVRNEQNENIESKIVESRLWECPRISLNILCHPFQQEVDSVLRNERVFLNIKDNRITSYCVLSDQEEFQQVKDVFTFSSYRGKGYAKELLGNIIQQAKQPLYLICRSELEPFYESVGFVRSVDMPDYMYQRIQRINALVDRFLKRVHIVMAAHIQPRLMVLFSSLSLHAYIFVYHYKKYFDGLYES